MRISSNLLFELNPCAAPIAVNRHFLMMRPIISWSELDYTADYKKGTEGKQMQPLISVTDVGTLEFDGSKITLTTPEGDSQNVDPVELLAALRAEQTRRDSQR